MTATTRRRPGPASPIARQTVVYVAHLAGKLRAHVHDAETAQACYQDRHAGIVRRWTDPAKVLVELREDRTLADTAATLAHHRHMAGMYAAALTGELAADRLLARHRTATVPPAGER